MNGREWMERLQRGTCAVIGLGVSNLPLIRYLRGHGVSVTARDKKTKEELGDVASEIASLGVPLILGETYLSDLTEDYLFRTPGLRPDLPAFEEAKARGAIVTSEMELFLRLTPAYVIGITGSDGKTTTTTLTGLFLEAERRLSRTGGKIYVGGNIGSPLLAQVDAMTKDDIAVVELSSFQLFDLPLSPHRAAITNLTENHLDWHRDMEEYGQAKTHIFRHAPNELLVTNAENAAAMVLCDGCQSPITLFSSKRELRDLPKGDGARIVLKNGFITVCEQGREEPILATRDILLPGKHNLENYMTAIALTRGLVSPEAIREVATTFPGVPHRMERVAEINGVTYLNSSIDSTPARTEATLAALEGRLIVICGGYNKNVSLVPLARTLNARAAAVVLTGASAEEIQAALEQERATLPILIRKDFAEAVAAARSLALAGDTVVLSPACASFDAFLNYKQRGERFRELVTSASQT